MTSPTAPSAATPITGWWVGSVAKVLSVTGIGSSEVFGLATISFIKSITAVGISSSEAFGTASFKYNQNIATIAIGSSEAFGINKIDQSVGGAGIPSAETFGAPVVSVGVRNLIAVGLPTSEEFGSTSVVAGNVSITTIGISSGEAFGLARLGVILYPVGVAADTGCGTPSVTVGPVNLSANGIASGEAFGMGLIGSGIGVAPPSITSAEVFGNAVAVPGPVLLSAIGIASAQAFGSTTVNVGAAQINTTSIASSESFGSPTITTAAVNLIATGIVSAEGFGVPQVNQDLKPTAISSGETFGLPNVNLVVPQSITATGIPSGEAFGPISTVWDGYDIFTDIANGSPPILAETGQAWSYFASSPAVIPEVRSGYMDAPLASGGSTTYPELDMGTKITKMGCVCRINTIGGTRTGTGWGIGLITWADGGLHANWPTIPRTSGHIVITATQAIYYGIQTVGGTFAASQTWNHGATIPDNTDFFCEIEFLFGTNQMIVKLIVGGTTYSTTWTDAKIVGYTGENWACYQSYYGGSASNKRIEFKEIWVSKLAKKTVFATSIPTEEAFGNHYVNRKLLSPNGIASSEAFGTAVLTGGTTALNYTDSATGADNGTPSSSMGADWSTVVTPGSGYAIRRINNEWGIEYGNLWQTSKNNVATPTTTKYEVGIKNKVAGALIRVYASERVYVEYNGSACGLYTCSSDYASSGTAMSGATTSSTTFASGDIISVLRNGNTYTVYKNGVVTTCTGTETANAAKKQPGIGMYAASTSYRLDDFFCKDVP